jgi:hypothetical protein
MASLNWLAASAKHLAATLKVLIIECEVKGPIPPEVGMLHQLVTLDLSTNNIDGAIKRSFHCDAPSMYEKSKQYLSIILTVHHPLVFAVLS